MATHFRGRPRGSGAFFADPAPDRPEETRGENPSDKRPFIVNILDRDMQREIDIETWAVSPRKAEANAWFRLMTMEEFTGAVGVFRKRYAERYVIRAREEIQEKRG